MTFDITNVAYTTIDRQATFRFDFVQIASAEWRVYIRRQPEYAGRPDDSYRSHRLSDARGHYICWAPSPRSLNEAKGVARAWADATHEYIRTGAFPPPGPSRHVPDLSTSAGWQFRDHEGLIPAAPAPPTPPDTMQPANLLGIFRRNR